MLSLVLQAAVAFLLTFGALLWIVTMLFGDLPPSRVRGIVVFVLVVAVSVLTALGAIGPHECFEVTPQGSGRC